MPHMPLMTHRVLCSETTSVSYSRPWRSRLDARDPCKDHHRCRGGRDSGRPVGVDRGLGDGGGGGAIAVAGGVSVLLGETNGGFGDCLFAKRLRIPRRCRDHDGRWPLWLRWPRAGGAAPVEDDELPEPELLDDDELLDDELDELELLDDELLDDDDPPNVSNWGGTMAVFRPTWSEL